jgi:hypothetical protein
VRTASSLECRVRSAQEVEWPSSTIRLRCDRVDVVNSARLARHHHGRPGRPREGVGMAEDQSNPHGSSNHDDRSGQRPTAPVGGPTQPPEPPPASSQPGRALRSPARIAPSPGGHSASVSCATPEDLGLKSWSLEPHAIGAQRCCFSGSF